MLAVLLLRAGRVVSRTQLIDGLWGDSPPPTAAKAVNVYVSQMRKTLARNGVEAIATRPPGYVLTTDPEALDAARFERLAAAARERERAGEVEAAAALMGEALELWRGPALAGIELESEGRDDVARLDQLRLAAELDLVDYKLTLGEHEQLVPELERLAAQHPLDERIRGQLLLALYRSGRQAEALGAYRDARATLVNELGLEPSAPLQRLEQAILNHDPSLEAPTGVARRGSMQPVRRRRRAAAISAVIVLAVLATAAWRSLSDRANVLHVDADSVGVIDGDHASVLASLSVPARPVALAVGMHAVWLSTSRGALVRSDFAHPDRIASLLVGGRPGAIALARGSVWMLDADRGQLDRIDPTTQRVVKTIRVGNGPTAIASGFDALWIANELDGTLVRADAVTGATRTIPVGQHPDGVAVGAGSVWASDAGRSVVLRIQPGVGVVAAINVGSAPGALAYDGNSVWVANRDDGTVARIEPGSNSVQATIPIGSSADGVAVAGRSLWAISTADGTLARIDPATSRVVRTWKLGSSPAALAGEGSRLVVATQVAGGTHRGGTLRLVGDDGQPVTLDPATWWSSTGWSFLSVTNDGLLTVRRTPGSSGLQIVPDLARAAPLIREGGRSYTFQLRSGIRYSDGRPVRASDVRASFERLWKLRSPAESPELRLGLVGETRCSTGRRCDLSRGIRVDDTSGTVTFRLVRPNALFQRLLTLPFYDVLPMGTPARDGRLLPATGPYRITRFVPGRSVEAERNPLFRVWSTAAQPAGYPDRIAWLLRASDRASVAKVLDGGADYAVTTGPRPDVATISERHAAQVHNEPFPWLFYLFLNTHVAPFDDANVRRALNLAIDRRRIIDLAGGPLVARPTCQIIPPSFAGYRASCPYTIDPNPAGTWIAPDLDRARALLRKAGTPRTRVIVSTLHDPVRIAIGRYVTGLLRTLGFRAELLAFDDISSYYGYVSDSRHHAQIGLAGWGPDIRDPSAFFEPVLTCASYVPRSAVNANLAGYCDRRTDIDIRRAETLAATNPGASSELWAAIDRRIGMASPWVPLYATRWTDVLSNRLGNYEYNPMFGFLIDQAWVQ